MLSNVFAHLQRPRTEYFVLHLSDGLLRLVSLPILLLWIVAAHQLILLSCNQINRILVFNQFYDPFPSRKTFVF